MSPVNDIANQGLALVEIFNMSDSDDCGEETSAYGQYQLELYKNGALLDEPPVVTTNPNKLEQQAREAMSAGPFNYIYGGAGEGATMDANRLAFRQWKLIPRFLRPTVPRDLSVRLFGHTYCEHMRKDSCEMAMLTAASKPCDHGPGRSDGCIP